MLRRFFLFILLLLVMAAALLGYGYWWIGQPLHFANGQTEVTIERGTSARDIAQQLSTSGTIPVPGDLTYVWLRATGDAPRLKAGYYEFKSGVTPRQVVGRIVRGDQTLLSMTIVEGWTFHQVRELLAREPVVHETAGLSSEQIMERLGRKGVPAEGSFFPDTYRFAKGSTDLSILQQAMKAMEARLAAAWKVRDQDTPLKTPEQALILASIIEKETGLPSDRARIAGVFINRLRIGMRLQTDPTVIYGLGPDFVGPLRRVHLETDTPWNTYTRAGLPPTPISMPGAASLLAAVQPQKTSALYFVSRGDGSSQFSNSLVEHNRAVNEFIRGRK